MQSSWRSLGIVVAIGAVLCACSPAENGTSAEGSGGNVAPGGDECGAPLELEIQTGYGEAGDFVAFAPGDALALEVASQTGFAAVVTLKTMGVSADELSSAQLDLIIEDAAIGEATVSGRGLQCQGEEFGLLEASIPIDVTEHPTVSSVAQLDGVPATLNVELVGASGTISETSIELVLDL